MIIVDRVECRGCGQCARICHEQCIVLVGENGHRSARVDHALCSTCTQCIAICPRQALSWEGVPPTAYDASRLPSAEQLAELFQQRRTVRCFSRNKIDRGPA